MMRREGVVDVALVGDPQDVDAGPIHRLFVLVERILNLVDHDCVMLPLM